MCHGSPFSCGAAVSRARYAGDLDLGVGLPIAAEPVRVLAPAQLEAHRFFAEAVSEDLRLDRSPFYHRGSDFERLPVTDKEDLVEHELTAHRGGELLDPELFSCSSARLCPSCSGGGGHAGLRDRC